MAQRIFGRLPDGTEIIEITVATGDLRAQVLSWGTVVRDLRLAGVSYPLVLGLNSIENYVAHSPHFGATAGRFANRIAGGRFELDGRPIQLETNENNRTHLHGGKAFGFSRRPWNVLESTDNAVTLEVVSQDGEAGYPGTLTARCRYEIISPGTLHIEFEARTDAPTIVNLAHHGYFNLSGGLDILDHHLQIAANSYTPVDADLIPTGEIRSVAETTHDFRDLRAIRREEAGQRIRYDHNFVLADAARPAPAFAARAEAPDRSVAMTVATSEPGIQFYDGAKINCPVPGLDDRRYGASAGFCLEAQRFPDAPNHANFPSAVLRPSDVYRQVTEYRFERG